MARFSGAIIGALSLLFVGCVGQAGAERIIGPDGTQMLHVHCGDEQVACFQLAGERCTHGYDLSPIFDPHDGNFLVRCRASVSAPGVVATASSPLPAGRSAVGAQPRPTDGWPPAEVATPSEPWPATSSTPLPAAPRAAAVDSGY